eukprot:CAMPEP_0195126920 /NCGR_PEP_ID=MMETSP0448-20130528/135941_1 /TAXON_ID=66468 /ORGANISM="Heterocapsa triquestra, Strain CCMP 448" /LENGTH=45 /DNA_ID= /DNA_START= /DNA_END= /DNA_ORIENTATION=
MPVAAFNGCRKSPEEADAGVAHACLAREVVLEGLLRCLTGGVTTL